MTCLNKGMYSVIRKKCIKSGQGIILQVFIFNVGENRLKTKSVASRGILDYSSQAYFSSNQRRCPAQ